MDLKDFIRRSAVLQLYRQLLKTATKLKQVDDGLSTSTVEQIKTQFRINQQESSKVTIAVMIQEGRQQLQLLTELYESRVRGTARAGNSADWKGSVDSDGQDERGRVGSGFPWERD